MPKLKTESVEQKTQGDLRGSNVMAQLLSYVERYERLQEERDALGDDQGEIMAEAKGIGLDTKIMRTVIRRRKMDPADRQEVDAMLEIYEEAVQQAEKQQVAKSIDEGSEPSPPPAAKPSIPPKPATPKKLWGKKPAAETPPAQMDVEELAPSENDVEAEATRQITHVADHPEKDGEVDLGKAMPSFLRRGK